MKLGQDIAAVVTGGASGLGAATARALAAQGRQGRASSTSTRPRAQPFAKEIGGSFAKCDVTNEADVDAALASGRAAHGQERILVNCAGVAIGQAHRAASARRRRHRAARPRRVLAAWSRST